MKKFILAAAVSAAALASPAAARDGASYFGIEGGILFPKDQDIDLTVVQTTTSTTVPPVVTTTTTDFDDAIGLDYKRGFDVDLIAGYDFGMFRLEGELGLKRASLNDLEFSDELADDVDGVFDDEDLDVDGRARVLSGMLNGLVDFGNDDGVSFYAGGGVGRARVKFAGERDSAWAYQLIAGVRTAISDNIDLGLKYRYFRTGKLDFFDETTALVTDDGLTTDTAVFGDFEQRFRSHSLLASLIFNFGGVEAAPPPRAPPPPPPPPPAPATQTCPDGSVILATDSCPLPPPPPPPPPPAPERG